MRASGPRGRDMKRARGKAAKGPRLKAGKIGSAQSTSRHRRPASVGLQKKLEKARRELRDAREQQTAVGVQLILGPVHDAGEIERVIETFARDPGGVIVLPDTTTAVHREMIARLCIKHRLPSVLPFRHYVLAGGLIGYGINIPDVFGRAAGYVDRILKGEKPGDLPVQAPTKFEMIINLKTAQALGLMVPPTLIARADEVME
jgi:ABC-type uncharacterized transport system substrate-binding protein